MGKRCRACLETKPFEDFYEQKSSSDGLMAKCKTCWCAQVRERRRTNPEVQAYDRARAKLPHRKAAAREITIRWRKENPEAYRAETAVSNAIRDGKLAKGEVCEVEGCDRTDVHAHHDDYSKPLEVRWMCPLHHQRHHAQEAA